MYNRPEFARKTRVAAKHHPVPLKTRMENKKQRLLKRMGLMEVPDVRHPQRTKIVARNKHHHSHVEKEKKKKKQKLVSRYVLLGFNFISF